MSIRRKHRPLFFGLDTFEARRLLSTSTNSAFYGVATDLDPTQDGNSPIIQEFNKLGVKSVRIYHSTTYASVGGEWDNDFVALRRFHDAGIQTTVVITPPEKYIQSSADLTAAKAAVSIDNVGNYMTDLVGHAFAGTTVKLTDVVDRWEIGNESDTQQYYPWYDYTAPAASAQHYMDHLLIPSYNALKLASTSELVVGVGPTSSNLPQNATDPGPQWMQSLISDNYTHYCDIANMHPYKTNAQAAINASLGFINAIHAKNAVDHVLNMPVTVTEMNAGFYGENQTTADFAGYGNTYQAWAKDNLDSMFYYIFESQDKHGSANGNGPNNIIDYDGYLVTQTGSGTNVGFTENTPLADMYKAWTHAAVVAPSAPALSASAITSTTASLAWTAPANVSTYTLQRRASTTGAWTTIYTSPTATSYADSGLSPSTTYYYQVIASNAGGSSPASNTVTLTTTASNTTVKGRLFNDANNNGIYDSGETPDTTDVVFIDFNDDGIYGTGDIATRPDANGLLNWTTLPADGRSGFVRLRGVADADVTGTKRYAVTLNGGTYLNVDFGRRATATNTPVKGRIFNDVNNNGVYDSGDTTRSTDVLFIDFNDDGIYNNDDIATRPDANGVIDWSVLPVDGRSGFVRLRGVPDSSLNGTKKYAVTLNGSTYQNINFAFHV